MKINLNVMPEGDPVRGYGWTVVTDGIVVSLGTAPDYLTACRRCLGALKVWAEDCDLWAKEDPAPWLEMNFFPPPSVEYLAWRDRADAADKR